MNGKGEKLKKVPKGLPTYVINVLFNFTVYDFHHSTDIKSSNAPKCLFLELPY